MRDFSLDIYRELLETLQRQGYELVSYADYMKNQKPLTPSQKLLILRHDVDAKPENSLRTAQIEHALGAKPRIISVSVKKATNRK